MELSIVFFVVGTVEIFFFVHEIYIAGVVVEIVLRHSDFICVYITGAALAGHVSKFQNRRTPPLAFNTRILVFNILEH